ncbi:MAG TPA: hypothetical protein VIM55_18750 [Mucilaginibacter sp.]
MQKALLKLLLALFIFTVTVPGVYTGNEPDGGSVTDYYRASIKKQDQALPLVKNIHHAGVNVHPAFNPVKPFFQGDLHQSLLAYAVWCSTFTIQNKRQIIYRKNYLRSVLFPHHFFG